MQNDAVGQGLSQIPFMQDVSGWGILTIGTGLGNAHFSNKLDNRNATWAATRHAAVAFPTGAPSYGNGKP